jgi:lipid II:glycine glycyltransferase (peptidoglycan interpeptide bridge formation enzyme)
MYEVFSFQQKTFWEEKLNTLSKKDIFYHPSYSGLYQSMGDGEPHLFFYEDQSGKKVGYVFLKRKIKGLPFAKHETNDDIYDIITPSYGYGGPLYDMEEKQLVSAFRKEFEEYCQKENIICEFIRFHPLLQNSRIMAEFVDTSFDRETIFIDLTKTEKEIFNNYHTNHKRNINKANKKELVFRVFKNEEALEVVETFYQLYKETMDKLNASTYSYFSTSYIKDLLSHLSQYSMIGAVFYKDQMVAASMCLYEGNSLHYHLGCSNKEYLHLGVNTFLLHQLGIWGKRAGLERFHLGGGHKGRDSLFQFKSRFNPDGVLPFYIGRKVHNPVLYNQLIEKWENYYEDEVNKTYFPAYRSVPQKTVSISG